MSLEAGRLPTPIGANSRSLFRLHPNFPPGSVYKTTFVCFTDRYRRDAPWNEADLLAVPDRYRSEFRPQMTLPNPGTGTMPRGGKYR